MVRMVDVASRAGVSVATVSNFISGKKYVSDEIKQKVKQAIDDLGYEVNIAARCLKIQQNFQYWRNHS